ncbi:MAG: TonB-dependent receptor [Methylacidiphilales bacterium]|nr:TonB-dependent receptor [Candidatus Methylacidiphilales bacterium]
MEPLNTTTITPHEKAVQINLDRHFYGTFAEIGAGQEVARWFFRVGGASGTLAKTISAYDMAFSDAIYGKGERYVSLSRLQNILDYEFKLLIERLGEKRGAETSFFVFSDTVSARNYLGTNECHGWMGIKFQLQPQAEPSEIIIHVNMLDKENLQQQEALGIIGVNLTYGAFYLHSEPQRLIASLLDGLSTLRIEVDMIKFLGPYFHNVDNRLMALQLVEKGLSNAALIGASGDVLQPSEILHKKPILIERGSFRPVTYVNLDMLDGARRHFLSDAEVKQEEIVELMEITMSNLLTTGSIDHRDFLARADTINAVGKMVLISNYAEYYKLAAYLQRYTKSRIGIVLGIPNLKELFDEKYYEVLEGGILESFGRLFKNDLKIYVYPFLDPAYPDLTTVQNMEVPERVTHLFKHLMQNGFIEQIENFHREYLGIFSRAILAKIRQHDHSWEQMVPPEVAARIKHNNFFGYTS